MDWRFFLIGIKGRINRSQWCIGVAAVAMVYFAAVFITANVIVYVAYQPSHNKGLGMVLIGKFTFGDLCVWVTIISTIAIILACSWAWMALTIKRLQDRNKHRAWIMLVVIPIIGALWLIIECGLFAGVNHRTHYGPVPGSTTR